MYVIIIGVHMYICMFVHVHVCAHKPVCVCVVQNDQPQQKQHLGLLLPIAPDDI